MNKEPYIKIADSSEFKKLIPALLALRPHRTEEEILDMLPEIYKENYLAAYIGDDEFAYSVIGFRVIHTLYSGKTLYVDDLSTHPDYRKKGYAEKLFKWTIDYAKSINCEHFSLDSGFQRRDAYRFYLNQGLFVESMHFGVKLSEI